MCPRTNVFTKDYDHVKNVSEFRLYTQNSEKRKVLTEIRDLGLEKYFPQPSQKCQTMFFFLLTSHRRLIVFTHFSLCCLCAPVCLGGPHHPDLYTVGCSSLF